MPKRTFNKTSKMFNRKKISFAAAFMFIAVTIIMIISNRYVSICVNREAQAQQNRIELSALGQSLADASDYLTDEARKYSVTGNIEHLYNYWYEVNEKKTRETVIDELFSYDPPENEKKLMLDAKSYSDTLIETEIVSMRLTLSAQKKTAEDFLYDQRLYGYVKYIEQYELPVEYMSLSPEQMSIKAREILYDSFYDDSKTLIMSPIEEFQKALGERLDSEVAEAAEGRSFASHIQVIFSAAVLALIAVLLLGLNFLYIRPINEYSNELSYMGTEEQIAGSRLRVTPQGAYELYRFGKIFNHLSLILSKELKKRTEAEQKMRVARDEADKANNAKSEFFAQMSHELRTPLNAITGYLYLLERTVLNEKQKKYCRCIEISSENLLELINNVLDFSKIESGNMQFESADFNLIELLQDIRSIMENGAMQKNIALRLDISGDIPMYVKGDSLRLRQILINLLGNALKFTSDGEIVLSAEYLRDENGKAVMEFAVTDTGIGIDKEDITKIFEPFIQSDAGVTRKFGGTGLGLPISQMIVQNLSGGKYGIEVRSEKGKGSLFRFIIEFEYGCKTDETSQDGRDTPLSESALILLVDDNKVNLDIEKEILQAYGAEVVTAESGKSALDAAEKITPDLIFLDLHMPDMDGYETAKRIRNISACRLTPIIALTADVVLGVEDKVRNSGMNDYMSKPFKPDKLRDMIEKYLGIVKHSPQLLCTGVNSAFDYKMCLQNLGGNMTALISSVNRFLQSNKHTCEYISEHINNGNFSTARRILHDVIGVSGNLCCQRLYDTARTLSGELQENNCGSAEEFYSAWEEAVGEMQTFSDKNKAYGKNKDNAPFEEKYEKFIRLCRDYDITAVEYFEENSDSFKENLGKDKFRELKEYVQRYDFTKITERFSDSSQEE